jgi:hypothetical protein
MPRLLPVDIQRNRARVQRSLIAHAKFLAHGVLVFSLVGDVSFQRG